MRMRVWLCVGDLCLVPRVEGTMAWGTVVWCMLAWRVSQFLHRYGRIIGVNVAATRL